MAVFTGAILSKRTVPPGTLIINSNFFCGWPELSGYDKLICNVPVTVVGGVGATGEVRLQEMMQQEKRMKEGRLNFKRNVE